MKHQTGLHAELGKVQMFYGVEQGDSYAWEDSELTHLKTCTQHSPFCERYCSLRSYARLSSPALFRAEARASRVGQGWFEGAHFNHRLSISLKQPVSPSGISSGLCSISVSSASRNPKANPITFHLVTAPFKISVRTPRSFSFSRSSPAGRELTQLHTRVCLYAIVIQQGRFDQIWASFLCTHPDSNKCFGTCILLQISNICLEVIFLRYHTMKVEKQMQVALSPVASTWISWTQIITCGMHCSQLAFHQCRVRVCTICCV